MSETGKLSESYPHRDGAKWSPVCGQAVKRDDETILFWHRGLSLSDIALGHAMLKKGERLGIGQRLRFA